MITKNSILLVDGDEGMRKSLSMFFHSRGYNLVAVENAQKALTIAHKEKFDIIICEMHLPDMDGLRFFDSLDTSSHASIKILICDYGDNKYQEDMRKHNINSVLKKPLSGDEIEAVLIRSLDTINR